MKKLLTSLLVALLVATSTFPTFAEYAKAKDDPLTEYAKEQFSTLEKRDVLEQHFKNESMLYHVFDTVEDKKPVTNEQRKTFNILKLKHQYIYDNYYKELNEAVLGIEEVFSEDILDYYDDIDGYLKSLDTTDEQLLKAGIDEYMKVMNVMLTFIEPVVSKYAVELAKLEKMVRVYEKM